MTWQQDIETRDCLEALCMFSAIANILYPNQPDREARLREIPEMARLERLLNERVESYGARI